MKRIFMGALSAALIATSACNERVCADIGETRSIVPADTTIAVGGTVTLRMMTQPGHCFGEQPSAVPDAGPTRWKTLDPAVVSVDSVTGKVVGLVVGNATVIGNSYYAATVRVR